MKQRWTPAELVETFTLSPDELTLLTANMADHTKLGFVVLLKFLQYEGRFPKDPIEAPTTSFSSAKAMSSPPTGQPSRNY